MLADSTSLIRVGLSGRARVAGGSSGSWRWGWGWGWGWVREDKQGEKTERSGDSRSVVCLAWGVRGPGRFNPPSVSPAARNVKTRESRFQTWRNEWLAVSPLIRTGCGGLLLLDLLCEMFAKLTSGRLIALSSAEFRGREESDVFTQPCCLAWCFLMLCPPSALSFLLCCVCVCVCVCV